MKNWDDLRILLAVVRGGSITAGANTLGIDQSTVSRRLLAFEERIGQSLFLGTSKRTTLSLTGQKCFEGALRLEKEIEDINKGIATSDQRESGVVHVVTSDILSNHLLLSVTSAFLQQHPQINLLIRSAQPNVERLEGDVALFATNSPKEDLFGRKLATASFATYASKDYLAEFKDRPQEMVWLNWDDGSDSPTWPTLAPHIPDHMCRLRIDTVATLLEATRLGVGATILPCFIGENDPALARITPGEIVSKRDIWLLVHADLRKVPRIRTFLDFFIQQIKSQRGLIEDSIH